jgi:Sulfotransferase family
MQPTYLFLLCPPWTGSTLLWKLISTAPGASTFESEGQFLPEVEAIMRSDPWNPDFRMPWQEIKALWDPYWDKTKPYSVEKSPPHIIRATQIVQHFQPLRFIVMVRDPYAHIEGIKRRRTWDTQTAAEFALMCLRHQKWNAEHLPDTLVMTYEQLVHDPKSMTQRISEFLPNLGTIDHEAEFTIKSIDGFVRRGVTDLNAKKIAALSQEDIDVATRVFRRESKVMEFWNYPLLNAEKLRSADESVETEGRNSARA